MNFEGLDSWRNFFKGANTSIFEIIENAIKVAAKDYTEEFKIQRRVIVDTVYSCWFTLHCGHHHSDLMQPEKTKQEMFKERPVNWDAKTRVNGNAVDLKANGSSETKYDSCRGDLDMRLANRSKYSYKEAEELVEEIDEENRVIVEVLRIKAILNNIHEEPEAGIFDSLRRLQLMDLSVEILQTTQVGYAVNSLRKHKSKQISQFAEGLICDWKDKVKGYLQSAAAMAESSTASDSGLSFSREEFGLPSPPLDDIGVLLFSQTPMELTKFFDDIDENADWNLQNSKDIINAKQRSHHSIPENNSQDIKQEYVTMSANPVRSKNINLETATVRPHVQNLEWKIKNGTTSHERPDKKVNPPNDAIVQAKVETRKNKLPEGFRQADNEKKQRLQEPVAKLATPTNANSLNNEREPIRPQQPVLKKTESNELDVYKNEDKVTMPSKLSMDKQVNEGYRFVDAAAMQEKLKATKKKLHTDYQQVQKDRSKRTIQIVELHELPKQGPGRANALAKQKKISRSANGKQQ